MIANAQYHDPSQNLMAIELSIQRSTVVQILGPIPAAPVAPLPAVPTVELRNIGDMTEPVRLVAFIRYPFERVVFGNYSYGSGAITDGTYHLCCHVAGAPEQSPPAGTHVALVGDLRRNNYDTLILHVVGMAQIDVIEDEIMEASRLRIGFRVISRGAPVRQGRVAEQQLAVQPQVNLVEHHQEAINGAHQVAAPAPAVVPRQFVAQQINAIHHHHVVAPPPPAVLPEKQIAHQQANAVQQQQQQLAAPLPVVVVAQSNAVQQQRRVAEQQLAVQPQVNSVQHQEPINGAYQVVAPAPAVVHQQCSAPVSAQQHAVQVHIDFCFFFQTISPAAPVHNNFAQPDHYDDQIDCDFPPVNFRRGRRQSSSPDHQASSSRHQPSILCRKKAVQAQSDSDSGSDDNENLIGDTIVI
ncbi:hypothetical protein HCN44_010891 [Aphidius gifuensis]|uniref:Uncharacterized protein n=1 Tax=Aphidius gifuensis TaxID=684658 RepID=A0A834Y7A0_APHGI|nr:hypothetical protein HCN44_010891 [Aphidius gifuensis]